MVRSEIIVFFASVTVAFAFEPNFPMETYTVDLNDPPTMRWNHILGNFNSTVPLLLKYYYDEV